MNDREKQQPDDDDPKSEYLRQQKERDTERDAPTAPHQGRPPAEQHRGGPLPNQKR